MSALRLLPLLPLALTAAAPPPQDALPLMECRLDKAAAETARAGLKLIATDGAEGETSYRYDVRGLRPLGTAGPILTVTESAGATEYRTMLAGSFPRARAALLKAHGVRTCTRSTAQMCALDTPYGQAELTLNARRQLALRCSY